MRLSSSSDITTKSAKSKSTGSNDIFEKCRNFTRPGDLQAAGLYMYFEVFGDREGCAPGEIRMGKRKILMFGSNDYLALIAHPKVREAGIQALRQRTTKVHVRSVLWRVHEPNDRTEVLRSSIIATFLKPIRVDEARRIIEWCGSNRLDQSSFVTRCGPNELLPIRH